MGKKEKFFQILIASIFVFVGVFLRLVPHPPNFAPILAIGLFGGAYLSRRIALTLPLGAMLISDVFLGFYEPLVMLSVYGSFVLSVVLGFWLKKNKSWYAIGGSAFLSAALFFVITNLAVFAFTPWYTKSFSGLIQCYLMALPFFKNTLASSLFYSGLFFGAYEAVGFWIKRKFGNPQLVVSKK